MAEKERTIFKTQNVFGQSRDTPLNYVERENIDDKFLESLEFNKHIVVYGSSKQGKTSLRKHNLSKDKYILVHCSNKWDLGQLNAQILKQSGFELQTSSTKTVEGRSKISAKFNILNLLEASGEDELGETESKEYKPLELDIYDSNDIINALDSIDFNKFIILEDFHYLRDETQKDFAFALKAFHENSSFTFIIVGVWLEENRLTLLNGDLAGRIFSIDADLWKNSQLKSVIRKGEKLLNIEFDTDQVDEIIKWSIGSVFILQEICQSVCVKNGIKETQENKKKLSNNIDIYQLTKRIVNEQTGRYNSFLMAFYHGFQETDLEMHKWLLYPILKSDTVELLDGITYRTMKEAIRSKHPRKDNLNLGNLTLALNSSASLQIKKNIKPNIIDYDQTNLILNIVDKGFIIWLLFQDREDLLDKLDLPKN